jgi:colanic acid biosynthesis protein WcaH
MKPKNYLLPSIFNTVVKHTPLIAIDFVIVNKGKILLGKRINRPAKDCFFVPGGRICKGEKIDEAFTRISETELGIKLDRKNCNLLGLYDHMYEDSANDENISTHYVVSAFHTSVDYENLNLKNLQTQHAKIVMLDLDSALSCPDVHENTKVYIRKLQE